MDAVTGEEEGSETRKVREVSKGGDVVIGEIDRILILEMVNIGSAKTRAAGGLQVNPAATARDTTKNKAHQR